MVKIAVVTCVFLLEFNELDTPSSNFDKCSNFDYYLFTNNKHLVSNLSDKWTIVEVKCDNVKNGVYLTKYIKWLTHECLPDYDIIIWVDSFIVPNHLKINDIKLIAEQCLNNELNTPIFMRTQKFKCIKDDINWCVANNRLTDHMASKITDYFEKVEAFPITDPVQTYWSSAMIKNNKNIRLQKLSKDLFQYITNICYRDQHILPVLFKKYNINCKIIPSTHNPNIDEIFINKGKQNINNHNYSDKIK